MSHPVGFEFLLAEGGAHRWTRLQGSGGLLGDGMLGGPRTIDEGRCAARLLAECRRDLRHGRPLREWLGGDCEPRSREAYPDAVLDCRVIWRD